MAIATSAPRTRRRSRTPVHNFHVRQQAFVIQPFLFHPVRPNETLKSLRFQSRVVTDPLANPLMGWHIEHFFFYVQLDDLLETFDASAIGLEDARLKWLWDFTTDALARNYVGASTAMLEMMSKVDAGFAGLLTYGAYRRVVEAFFREDGEEWNTAHKMNGNLAFAKRNVRDFAESAGSTFSMPDVTINIADGLTAAEIEKAMNDYEMLLSVSGGAVTTFEDYLASQHQGRYSDVRKAYRPELIRHVKEWSYPTNTINPTDGSPTSAVSWSVQQRADKDRFFRQAGLIVGVSVARPKVLQLGDTVDPANYLINGRHWLPQQVMDDPTAGLVAASGSIPIIWDSRDLFEHGGQFVNFDLTGAYKANAITWKDNAGTVSLAGGYPVATDINSGVFKTSTVNLIRQDGRVDMSILTDLPYDPNIGAVGGDEGEAMMMARSAVEDGGEIHPFETMADVATEYLSKLTARKAGNLDVQLPNVPAILRSKAL